MLKNTQLILSTLLIYNFFSFITFCSENLKPKDIIVWVKGNTLTSPIETMFKNQKNYSIIEIGFNEYNLQEKINLKNINKKIQEARSAEENKDSKIFLFMPEHTSQALHITTEMADTIDGVLLINPKYSKDYPLLPISKKLPKELPIVIAYTQENSSDTIKKDAAEQLYTWITQENQRQISYINQGGTTDMTFFQKVAIENNQVTESFLSELFQRLHSSDETIRKATRYDSQWQPISSPQSKTQTDIILQEENAQFNYYKSLIITGALGLAVLGILLTSLYKYLQSR